MDDVDLFIISKLSEDARTSFRKMAEELGVSPDTVINRFTTLRENGTIRGSTIVLNPKKIGYPAMAVFLIDISPTPALSSETVGIDSTRILDTLIKMRNIIVATKTVGDHDLLAIGVIIDFEHLLEVRNEIAAIPGVRDMEVSFWTEKNELSPKYFVI